MSRAASLAWLLVAAAVLAPSGLSSQAYPVAPVFEIEPPQVATIPETRYFYSDPLSAVPVGDGWAVAWLTDFRGRGGEGEDYRSVDGRLVSATAGLGSRFSGDFSFGFVNFAFRPRLVPTARGGFAVAWAERHDVSEDIMLQRWASGAVPLQDEATMVNDYHDDATHFGGSLAVTPSGRLIVAWIENVRSGIQTTLARPWMRIFTRTGEPVTGEIEIAPPFVVPYDEEVAPEVLMDTAGRILVVWWEPGPAGVPRRWWGRHFRTDGTPLGERFFVADGGFAQIFVAKRDGGGFIALWAPPNGTTSAPWQLRRFRSDGRPLGPPVVVGELGLFAQQLSVDRHGNLAVMMRVGEQAAIRLFNSYLVPQGEPVLLGLRPEDVADQYYPETIAVSLSDRGRLLTAWINEKPGSPRSVLGRIWETVRDDDLCLYRGNRFLCNTAGISGDRPDATISFGDGSAGNIPLMADVNADGRGDPCLYQNGRIVCDTAHDGGTAELEMAPFGRPGDAILLGDVNDDGRADPCVRRGTRFLCDVAHDGGEPEFNVGFGNPQDIPVMAGKGSVPCVYRQGLFLCDTARNGGAAELRINLRPWIGNRQPGEPYIPLLGDINGDGWNDACVYAAGGYFCGLLRPGSRFPVEVIDRNFGQAGDRAVLGNVDAL